MKTNDMHLARVARKLREAIGFVELGFASARVGPLGWGWTSRGRSRPRLTLFAARPLRKQHRYFDAAMSLKRAAAKFPAPFKQSAMLALSACYHQAGDHAGAIDALASARGAGPWPSGRLPGGGPA